MVSRNLVKKGIKASNRNKSSKNKKRPSLNPRPANPTSLPAGTPKAANPTSIVSMLEFPALLSHQTDPVQRVRKWCFKNGTAIMKPLIRKSYFLNGQKVTLTEAPTTPYTLRRGNVVSVRRQNIKIPGDVPLSSWSEITYEETAYDRGLKEWVKSRVTGWVNEAYLDDYNEKFPDFEVKIPHATKNSNDPQQFMTIEDEGHSQFSIRTNMCGQLCVAFVLKKDIDTILRDWKTKGKRNYYQSLVGRGQNKTTSQEHLKDILDLYYTSPDEIRSYRADLGTIPLVAPPTEPNYPHASDPLQERLKTHSLITLVRIDLNTGELKPADQSGQRNHWIVLEKITEEGNRVEIYNPFPNKRQEYSFREFLKALGMNPSSGWWVKRKDGSRGFRAEAPLRMREPLQVIINNRNLTYKAAQYIDVEGKKKRNLCGEFSVAFIVNDSIESVLETWKRDQQLLYEDIVLNDKTTGTHHLKTILRAYGYNNDGDFLEFTDLLRDPYTRQYLPSPGKIAKMLETYYLIAGVHIDGTTGRLKPPPAVPHWVVLDKLTPMGGIAGGNGGWVELYNPFSNCREVYSYSEFTSAIDPQAREYGAGWSGLWVKRMIVPKFLPPILIDPTGIPSHVQGRTSDRSNKRGKWTEAHLLPVLKAKIKSNKPANRIAAELAEVSGWDKKAILALYKKILKGNVVGKWTEAQLRAEIEKRSKANKPAHKIAAELVALSGWKRQEILAEIRKTFQGGGGEKWTEEKLLTAIQEQFQVMKSPHKVAAALSEESGWKNWEINRLLKRLKQAENPKGDQIFITSEEEATTPVDPQTIVQASKPWAEFRKWQNSLLSVPGSNFHRVRRWGDPEMIKHGFDVNQATPSNFQAVGLYNDGNKQFGAVSNFLRISHADVMRLKAMQIEDEYVAKREDWREQKMNWLCKFRGTIYFCDNEEQGWPSAPEIRWGTLALGGNLVQVEGTEVIRTKLRHREILDVEMARLKGFRSSDWGRPLDELLAEGLVHRCFCAYSQNDFGDSPKGIVYSPFYSPRDWDFSGTAKPTALYIPMEWLEPKTPEYLS